ncbi:hypothetical protein AMATHDRAFT_53889 [Amanita thiersii Skay4041]|uniref:Uncharacterized protein n=1 Tax=Amanita thiersii Skay4041 TaxID=703135 RepID=A0A2A9P0L4_9AGAR|nr:hypothetical protein AMATHDRAFT_53889 [Amanita thiersii Skay4041]
MVNSLQVLVDDQDPDIEYLCKVTQETVLGTYYNDTWTTIASQECGSSGWFRYSFIGTGFQITAPASTSSDFSIQIDNAPLVTQKGDGRYQSPELKNGQHTITYFTAPTNSSPAFDYLTYTASGSTKLKGRTIIHDDNDGTVAYGGNWTKQPPLPLAFDNSTGLYQNTAHWSTTVGDTVSYRFTGTSVLVMGITTRSDVPASITFILDGVMMVNTITNSSLDGFPMTKLFHALDLDAKSHFLFINMTDVSPTRPIGIDFIAYNASFDSLGDIQTPLDEGISIPEDKTQAVAIAGGVIGAAIFVAAIAICLFVWKRQRDQRQRRVFLMKHQIQDPWIELQRHQP